ncbi:MAG: galactokinase family protein [Candidatus Pacebacteria bacterium]|nr:galactokinase family protein [Candidatus Paceibacterota bacterium]
MEKKADNDFVPLKYNLEEIYDNSQGQVENEHLPKYLLLQRRFEEIYGEKPDYYARAPGRVNLIGEHIDYNGYPVLPAALEQDMIIAFKETPGKLVIEVHNFVENLYRHLKFPVTKELKLVDTPEDKWINYFLAAFQHIVKKLSPTLDRGFQTLIYSSVPVESGLSSSAAFSVASTLVPLMVYGFREKYTRTEMIPNIVEYERSIGVACGGMDQTISLFAESGTARFVEFSPIRTQPVKLPTKATLVIANSLASAPKLLTVGTGYNKRVVECRIGLVLLCQAAGICKTPEERKVANLQELQTALKFSFDQMLELVDKHIKKSAYTEDDIKAALGCPLINIVKDIPNHTAVLSNNLEYFVHKYHALS